MESNFIQTFAHANCGHLLLWSALSLHHFSDRQQNKVHSSGVKGVGGSSTHIWCGVEVMSLTPAHRLVVLAYKCLEQALDG